MNIGYYAKALTEFLKNENGFRDKFMNEFKQRHGMTDNIMSPELKQAFIDESTDYILNRGKELAENDEK